MTANIDLRIVELLCSRLCHDLISPVTAVNNGLELLADEQDDMADEIRALISTSAGEAVHRLQYYRIAYGLGGEGEAALPLDEARGLTEALMSGGKVTLDWALTDGAAALGRGGTKLLLNGILLAIEALPRGGAVALTLQDGGVPCLIATGEPAGLTDESVAALGGEVQATDVTVRTVQAYFTGRLAAALGGKVEISPRPGSMQLSMRVPDAA